MNSSSEAGDDFYIYAYFDPEASPTEPFYIGKGRRRRAYDHLGDWCVNKKATPFYNKLRKMKREGRTPHIKFIRTGLPETEALALERELIAGYGRRDIKTGCLWNLTDGGEGMAGCKVSAATRAKRSASLKGREFSPEHREKLSAAAKRRGANPLHLAKMCAAAAAKPVSLETRRLRSEAMRGRVFSPEHTANLTAAVRATRAKPVMGVPLEAGPVRRYEAAVDSRADGFLPQSIGKCCRGGQASHRGYRWAFAAPP